MRRYIFIFLFIISLGVAIPRVSLAAKLFLNAKPADVGIGQQVQAQLLIDTENESVNAFEGRVTYSHDLLELQEVRESNSIVSFWIEPPAEQDSSIVFSGVTPGGYQGTSGILWTAVFKTKQAGTPDLEIKDAKALLNDGMGTEASLTLEPFKLLIAEGATSEVHVAAEIIDYELPESFMPELARDQTVFDGKWFVVFATQDKKSGMDHFEITEVRSGSPRHWLMVESPYVLQDQELRSRIFIKAIDKAGNRRIVELAAQYPLSWYEEYWNWVILLIVGIIALWLGLRLWRKKNTLR